MHYSKNKGQWCRGLNDVEGRLKKVDRRFTQNGVFPMEVDWRIKHLCLGSGFYKSKQRMRKYVCLPEKQADT